MTYNLQLKKFDITKISGDKTVVTIGKRHTGKSYLMRDIMYHNRDIPVGTVISPTEPANSFFGDFIPKIFIHDKYDPIITANFMKRQKKMKKILKQGENIDNRAFLILDDCLYDKRWRNDEAIREIFFNGRHWNALMIISSQYSIGISSELRTNIDYTFIFRENIYSNRKRLYEQYCGMFNTFDMFCSVMDQVTEDFHCLVIDNHSKSNKLEDQVFWYRAESHPHFRIGPDEIWQYCNQKYIEEEEDDNDVNIDAFKKKKGPKLNVKKI